MSGAKVVMDFNGALASATAISAATDRGWYAHRVGDGRTGVYANRDGIAMVVGGRHTGEEFTGDRSGDWEVVSGSDLFAKCDGEVER